MKLRKSSCKRPDRGSKTTLSRAVEIIKCVAQQTMRDSVSLLAAALAYRFFLAIFPFFLFVSALGGFLAKTLGVENPARGLVTFLASLPPGIADVLQRQVRLVVSSDHTPLVSLGFLGALWASVSGMNGIIVAMNLAYNVEETRSWWRKRWLGIKLTLLAGFLLTVAFAVLVIGQLIGDDLSLVFDAQGVWKQVVPFLPWIVASVLALLGTAYLYREAPNLEIPWESVLPGTVVFVVGWLATTWVFSLYVVNFASYSDVYGALGGVAVLLIWFYLTAFILLLGIEVNAVFIERENPARIDRQRHERAVIAARKRRQRLGSATAIPTGTATGSERVRTRRLVRGANGNDRQVAA